MRWRKARRTACCSFSTRQRQTAGPIQELPIAQSELPESPPVRTQPAPPPTDAAAADAPNLYACVMSPTSPEAAREATTRRFQRAGSQGAYPGPQLEGIDHHARLHGGMEWGGAAVDPDGIYYAKRQRNSLDLSDIPTRGAGGQPVSLGERTYKIHCSYCHGLDRKGDSASGFPALNVLPRSSRAPSPRSSTKRA